MPNISHRMKSRRNREADIEQRFRSATTNHHMTIIADNDHIRQLRCAKPGTNAYSFTITTWGATLVVTGDMGTYVFQRETDMFSWFASARPQYDQMQRINPDYWSGKLEAHDKHRSGYEVFSEDEYETTVREILNEHLSSMTLTEAKAVVAHIRDEDMLRAPSTREEAITNGMRWTCPVNGSTPFDDLWDYGLTEYDFGFVFVCHAILWGIKQYDMVTQGRTQADVDRRVLSGAL